MARVCHVKAGHAVDDAQHKIERSDGHDGLYGQGGQIVHTKIGNIAKNQGQHQLADGRERGAEQIHYHNPHIISVVGDKSF